MRGLRGGFFLRYNSEIIFPCLFWREAKQRRPIFKRIILVRSFSLILALEMIAARMKHFAFSEWGKQRVCYLFQWDAHILKVSFPLRIVWLLVVLCSCSGSFANFWDCALSADRNISWHFIFWVLDRWGIFHICRSQWLKPFRRMV